MDAEIKGDFHSGARLLANTSTATQPGCGNPALVTEGTSTIPLALVRKARTTVNGRSQR